MIEDFFSALFWEEDCEVEAREGEADFRTIYGIEREEGAQTLGIGLDES